MLAYGEWIEEQILAPVPHRQYVFALPKLVRPYFQYHRAYLGQLCRLVADLLRSGFAALVPGGCANGAIPVFPSTTKSASKPVMPQVAGASPAT